MEYVQLPYILRLMTINDIFFFPFSFRSSVHLQLSHVIDTLLPGIYIFLLWQKTERSARADSEATSLAAFTISQ